MPVGKPGWTACLFPFLRSHLASVQPVEWAGLDWQILRRKAYRRFFQGCNCSIEREQGILLKEKNMLV